MAAARRRRRPQRTEHRAAARRKGPSRHYRLGPHRGGGGEPKAAPDTKTASAAPAAPGKDNKPAPPPAGTVIQVDGAALPSGAERAILERLQERRQELDARARELDIRESLIQGAEKRMDARLTELKDVEGRIKVETQQKDDAEAARLKGLITMYESMKPRDAAKIFDGLDSSVLLEVASKINPRTMAEILAQMSADVAQHLTVELASKAQQVSEGGPAACRRSKVSRPNKSNAPAGSTAGRPHAGRAGR